MGKRSRTSSGRSGEQDLLMAALVDRPGLLLVVSFAGFLLAASVGVVAQKLWSPIKADDQNEFNIVQSAALTLLGLIVGFSFSMAISRYDQRKSLEEAEANAIGTEYMRADFMPESAAAATRKLLKQYLDQRILYYVTADQDKLQRIEADSAKLATDLWASAKSVAAAQPAAVTSLVVATGMNDVLNAADTTTAAWLDRIPTPAWWLMIMIGVGSNVTLGFGAERFTSFLLVVLPLTVAVSMFLIADIDSPRGGVVQVAPQNLSRLAASLKGP
jgi:ABC-type uncharacterized transport system fused permease/ATPase subunit